ncbi:MAG: hypothetical protein EOM80_19600 [Erysipelotrichia bacterium]|nr:hypothetical protein [Erysipelotrichia bacterium]
MIDMSRCVDSADYWQRRAEKAEDENQQVKRLNDQMYLALQDACNTCPGRACENGAGCTIKDAIESKVALTKRLKGANNGE